MKFTATILSRLALLAVLTGCSNLTGWVTRDFAGDLSDTILNNPDLAMVRDGAPSYLILVDTLVARAPEDAFMLRQSATLNSAYAGAFVDEPARARLLHNKARQQALQAACVALKNGCGLDRRPFKAFHAWVTTLKPDSVEVAYALATVWAGWVQANSDDFTALADLARVKTLMQKVAELAPGYENGGVDLYLGVFETLLPPAMGGRPEVGRAHFEQAIATSRGENLLAKVMFAEQYARLMFDRDLHDRLLTDVLAAPAEVPGLTLMNMVAKERAQRLLETADDYF